MIKKLLYIIILFIGIINHAEAKKLFAFEDKKIQLFGFKNQKGVIAILPQFQNVTDSAQDEDLIPVVKNGIFYRMDEAGNLKFESVFYDNAWDYYEEGLARFVKNGKVGFHDKKGNIVISPQFDFARSFTNGYSVVCNGCWSYYPKSPRYQPMSSGHDIVIQYEFPDITGGNWGVINIHGQAVVPIKYNSYDEAYQQINRLPPESKN